MSNAIASPGAHADERLLQPRAKATRGKILAESAKVFDKLGYSASINDLVSGNSLSKGALFYHFPSKEAIAQKLVEDWAEVVAAAFGNAAALALPASAQLWRVFSSLAEQVEQSLPLRAGMSLSLETAVGGATAAYRKWVASTDALIATAIASGDVQNNERARRLAWTLCAGFTIAVLLDGVDGEDVPFTVRIDDLLTVHLPCTD